MSESKYRKQNNKWFLITFCILFGFLLLNLLLPVRIDIGVYIPFQLLVEGYEHPIPLANLILVCALFFPTYSKNALSRKIILGISSGIYLTLLYISFIVILWVPEDILAELSVGMYFSSVLSVFILILSFIHAWRYSEKKVSSNPKSRDLLDEF